MNNAYYNGNAFSYSNYYGGEVCSSTCAISVSGFGFNEPIGFYGAKQNLPKGVEMKNLYEVMAVYGENRNKPVIVSSDGYVVALDEDEAKRKSGIYKKVKEDWDTDYLTFIVRNIGCVRIKERPKEVKVINEKK